MTQSLRHASSDRLKLIHLLEQLQAALDDRVQPEPTVFTEVTQLIDATVESPAKRAAAMKHASSIEHCVAHRVFPPTKTYMRRMSTMLDLD